MHSQRPLLSKFPSSSDEQLRQQTNELLSKIVRANRKTQFAQAAPVLTEFRRALAALADGLDDSLSRMFRETVQLTTYDAYAPFIAKFFEKPCKTSSVVDLLAPGLPDYVVRSSSTSGSHQKSVPRYRCLPSLASGVATGNQPPIADSQKRSMAYIIGLSVDQIDVEDDQNGSVKKIYRSPSSVQTARGWMNLSPECDEGRMGTFVHNSTAPLATTFIKKWRPFLLTNAIFALASKSIETIFLTFISTLIDVVRCIDAEFDTVVDCIEHGTIPNRDGLEDVRHYLEPNLLPDPDRAEELRSLGPPSGRSGWCGLVWPNLRVVNGIASGSFASYVPLARWYLGSNINICSKYYGCSEASRIGSLYDPQESNLYKLTNKHIVEFLDINKSHDSVGSLSQAWEVEVGKQYEIVATTLDGLWRYRVEDVIEIAGFDPTDGVPVMKFIERRNVVMTLELAKFTEIKLRTIFSSAQLASVVGWTATIDDRGLSRTIGFFVELASEVACGSVLTASDRALDAFKQSDATVSRYLQSGRIGKPTIRLLRPGTFSDFLQLKLDEGNANIGQIKIPVVLPKTEYVTWFSDRVVREL